MSLLDENGTPPRRFYAGRTHDRTIAELLGLVKGVICDGLVTNAEAVSLSQWLESHPEAARCFPGDALAERLQSIFEDGIVDPKEQADLSKLLRDMVGETEDQSGKLNRSTRLPIDSPPPALAFPGKTYCFTGIFVYGTRARCQDEVIKRGGACADSVKKGIDYLVLGTVASDAWVHGAYGRKLEKAMEFRDSGKGLAIIAEEHWIESLRVRG